MGSYTSLQFGISPRNKMDDEKFNFVAVLKWVLAFCIAQWFQIPWVMRTLIVLMSIDYFTGLTLAFVHKQISSEVGFFGIYKKSLIIVILVAAQLFEKALGTDLHLQQFGALAYCANEFISILENCANAGVPIPQTLVDALLKVKQFRFQKASESELAELRTDEALKHERSGHVERSKPKEVEVSDEANE
jgi:toxin secretion/phage lysis holin